MGRLKDRLVHPFVVFRQKHFDDFIFIHINKTAGSSIEKALGIRLEHKTALEKIADLGIDTWNDKFTFAFVRNPWDKVVSHYHYRVKTGQTGLADNAIGFNDWVRLTLGEQDSFYLDKPRMFQPQSRWITDHDGKVLVDFVGRFEQLHEDFEQICTQIGRQVQLPHLKPSNRGAYRDYYDADSQQLVADWFSEDIERFDYHF